MRKFQLVIMPALVCLSIISGSSIANSDQQADRVWSIQYEDSQSFDNYIYYGVRGNVVWGHTFGFLKPKKDCSKDLLMIKWSSYNDSIVDIKGQDLNLALISKADSFTFEIPLETTYKQEMLLAYQTLFYGFMAGPKFFNAMDTSGDFTVSIDQSKLGSEYFDIPEDNFNLENLKETRYQATVKCLNVGDDPEKMYQLSKMLFYGSGVYKDRDQSDVWVKQAASLKHPKASIVMGIALLKKKQYVKAFEYLSVAAKSGHPKAAYYMADMLYNAKGVPKDIVAAKHWAEKAIATEGPKAKHLLAVILYKAEPPLKDKLRAITLFEEAAMEGHSQSMVIMANHAKNNNDTETRTKWIIKAAEHSHTGALKLIAEGYMLGDISNSQFDPFAKQIVSALETNKLKLNESDLFTPNKGTDYNLFARRLERFAKMNITTAQYQYAVLLSDFNPVGGESFIEAVSWLRISQRNGYKPPEQELRRLEGLSLAPINENAERLATLCIESNYEQCELEDLIEELKQ